MQTHIKVNNGWCYVIASVILVSLAQLCIKFGLNQQSPNAPYSSALLIITIGIICYAISCYLIFDSSVEVSTVVKLMVG